MKLLNIVQNNVIQYLLQQIIQIKYVQNSAVQYGIILLLMNNNLNSVLKDVHNWILQNTNHKFHKINNAQHNVLVIFIKLMINKKIFAYKVWNPALNIN